jgi:hypothetical protein
VSFAEKEVIIVETDTPGVVEIQEVIKNKSLCDFWFGGDDVYSSEYQILEHDE